MKYKIQSRTIFGWMDVMGDFDTISEAQERIPLLQEKLSQSGIYYKITSVLRIVETKENAVNDFYIYEKI